MVVPIIGRVLFIKSLNKVKTTASGRQAIERDLKSALYLRLQAEPFRITDKWLINIKHFGKSSFIDF